MQQKQQQQLRKRILNVAVGSRISHGLSLIGNSLSLLRAGSASMKAGNSSTSNLSSSLSPLELSAASLDVCSFRTSFLPSSNNNSNQYSLPIKWEETHVLCFSIESQSPTSAVNLSYRSLTGSGACSSNTPTLLFQFTLYLDAESPASFASELDRLISWRNEYIDCAYSQGFFPIENLGGSNQQQEIKNAKDFSTTIVLGRSEFAIEGGTKAVILSNKDGDEKRNKDDVINMTNLSMKDSTNLWAYVFLYLQSRALLTGMALVSLPQDWKQPEYASQAYRFAHFIANGQPKDYDTSSTRQSLTLSNTSRDCFFLTSSDIQGQFSRLVQEHKERISLTNHASNLLLSDDKNALIEHGCSLTFFTSIVPGASDYDGSSRGNRIKWRRKKEEQKTEDVRTLTNSIQQPTSSPYLSFSDWVVNLVSTNVNSSGSSSSSSLTTAKPRSSSASSLLQTSLSARPPSTPMSVKTPAPPKVGADPNISSSFLAATPSKRDIPIPLSSINNAPTPLPSRSSIISSSSKIDSMSSSSLTAGKGGDEMISADTANKSGTSSSLLPLISSTTSSIATPLSSSRRHSTSSVDIPVASTPSRPPPPSIATLQQPISSNVGISSTPGSQKPPIKKDAAKFFKEMLKKT
jgi:hypothetical protein